MNRPSRRLVVASLVLAAAACSRVDEGRRSPSPEEIVAQNNRGVGLMGQFDHDAARNVFAALAASSPGRLDLQVNLALATLNRQREGDERDAMLILERVIAADPRHVKAHYASGLLLLNDGRPADALPHFTFAAEQAPADAYAAYYVAQCRFSRTTSPERWPGISGHRR